MKLSNEAFVVVGLGIATLLVLVFAVATQETELPRDEITKIVDEQVPEWARQPDPPTTPDELPSHEQADTEYLGSRAGNLFWENLNLVPDGPGTTSGIGDVLMVFGEDDQDYRWRPITANPDYIELDNLANLNRQSVADAEGRIDLEIRNRDAAVMDEANTRATADQAITNSVATVTARLDALAAPGNEFITVSPVSKNRSVSGVRTRFNVVLQGFTARSYPEATTATIRVHGVVSGRHSWSSSDIEDRVIPGRVPTDADAGTILRAVTQQDHVAVSLTLSGSSGDIVIFHYNVYFR